MNDPTTRYRELTDDEYDRLLDNGGPSNAARRWVVPVAPDNDDALQRSRSATCSLRLALTRYRKIENTDCQCGLHVEDFVPDSTLQDLADAWNTSDGGDIEWEKEIVRNEKPVLGDLLDAITYFDTP